MPWHKQVASNIDYKPIVCLVEGHIPMVHEIVTGNAPSAVRALGVKKFRSFVCKMSKKLEFQTYRLVESLSWKNKKCHRMLSYSAYCSHTRNRSAMIFNQASPRSEQWTKRLHWTEIENRPSVCCTSSLLLRIRR